MAVSTIDPNGLNIGQIGGTRNLIINGAMQMAQRGTSFSGLTNGTSVTYTVDRFAWVESGSTTATFVVTQETDAPDGFGNSLKISPSTAGGGHNVIEMYQPIESQNCLPLAFGTSNAKSFTLSFWVKSNQTGTGTVCFYNLDSLRIRAENYTISAADTWEYKTIVVSGDTSGSTFANDNGAGLTVRFPIAASAAYSDKPTGEWAAYDDGYRGAGMTIDLTGSTSDYFTGVQLEVGDTATPFEHRSYGQELALCQRYYYKTAENYFSLHFIRSYNNSNEYFSRLQFPVTMRAEPTISWQNNQIRLVNIADTTGTFVTYLISPDQTIQRCVPASDYGAYTYTVLARDNSVRADAEL